MLIEATMRSPAACAASLGLEFKSRRLGQSVLEKVILGHPSFLII